ncbi:unnamed protein product [Psylliodes chrysocephalus]|uniref:DNA-directed DNA polymerase n=1 Tax=Psylliodes chrysocephalus TaxID=3402493 RepID=A0A9P0CKP2_9CUCU|nr:unnamed protein product [Psylliodes chrysocephala]
MFKNKINKTLKDFSVLKVNTTFCGEFIKKSGDNEILDLKYFNTKNAIIDTTTDKRCWFAENVYDKILNKLSEFQEKDSGYALNKVISLEVNINKFEMGNGSSFIKLPEQILKKQACINIRNSDHACFYWAIVSALYPAHTNLNSTYSYPHYSSVLHAENLNAPMTLHQISKFEKNNDISVNVYALELNVIKEKSFYTVVPARLTKLKHEKHVNLLLIQNKYFPKLNDYEAPPMDDDADNTEITYHYCWIKDLSRLVSKQLSKNTNKKFICDRCLNYYSSEKRLTEHEKLCSDLNNYKMSAPKLSHVEFRNFTYKQTTPFVIYADFECQLKNFVESGNKSKTVKYQKHIPYSAGFYVKCSYDDNLSFFKSYRGTDCMDWFRLKDTSLPSIKHFYNKLNDEIISDEKYAHAQKVWSTFEIQNLGDYSDLYLKTDVLLLADIFEQFRKKCHHTYGLDPAWYYTMPGYTWDCMLKYTKCKLQLLKDMDMIMFIEKAIRDGISVCSNRFSEANNKYKTNYDPSLSSKYLMYLDVNNLYGWAMCEPLPYDGFRWVDDITNFDPMTIPDDSEDGYILQVDLEYPRKLHDLHKDFPFAAEHRKPPGSKLNKLMTTLHDKSGYTIHYRNLKQALANGLVLKKIHKILTFKQSTWLKPYIELNTQLRAAATNDFEKNLYKLANNAVFGKTMENIRKHRVVKLVNSWNGRYGAKNLISSFRFHSRTIFDDDLVAIELKKTQIIFNKPLYVGMAILDLSKLCMYDFHYKHMLPKLGVEKCKLMYMDTDSFIYELQCDDACFAEVLFIIKYKDDCVNNLHEDKEISKRRRFTDVNDTDDDIDISEDDFEKF